MDFWRFLADGKSLFLPEELDLSADNVTRERNKATGHDFRGPSNYALESNAEAPGNSELGFRDAIGGSGKAYSVDQRGAALGVQIGTHSCNEVGYPSSHSVARQIQPGQFETGVDLKLGRLPDATKGTRSIEFSNESQHLCSSSSTPLLPAKRTRMTGLSSQSPFCQVEGCNRDLSSFKDYYKRHRVCDAHTKTATVVVNGIQQRFCQQCSRFHLLAEFDDVKRSCRKRLANHNERRRKPHGVKFSPSSVGASFVFQEMLPQSSSSCFGNPESGKLINGPVKFKEPTTPSPTSFLDFSCSGKGSDNVAFEVGNKMVKFDQPAGSSGTSRNPSVGAPESSTCALSLLSSEFYNTCNTNLLQPSVSRRNQNHYISTQGLSSSPCSSERSGGASYNNAVDCTFMGPSNSESSVVDLYQLSSHLKRVERKRDLEH